MNHEPEQHHHRRSRRLGPEPGGPPRRALDIAAVDAATHLTNDGNGPALLLALAVHRRAAPGDGAVSAGGI